MTAIAEIIQSFADVHKIGVKDITGRSRRADIVKVRHSAMYAAKLLTGASLKTIARAFGRRDHTTVIHACRRFTDAERHEARKLQMRLVRGLV